MNWKEFVTDYLTFSRRDRIAIITISLFILAIFFLPRAINLSARTPPAPQDTSWVAALRKLELKQPSDRPGFKEYDEAGSSKYQFDRSVAGYEDIPKGELFSFDPNTLPAEGWSKLGLREKTIKTIQNYISKGGRFKKPEDLERIYGLHKDEYERIAPFVRIESTWTQFAESKDAENMDAGFVAIPKAASGRYNVIDINTADTTAFIALPGIGSKLAARIISFRDKLGGFYAISQVGETYGLPDSTFQKIKQYLKLENNIIKKININTATLDELKAHPYIRYSLANPIVAYRKEHGSFTKVEDLKKVMVVTDEVYNKISPYLFLQ